MAAPRIYFLYPSFFRIAGAVERGPIRTSVRHRPAPSTTAKFCTSSRRNAEARQRRYGSAKEPPPHLLGEPRAGRGSLTDRPPRPESDSEGQAEESTPTPAEEKPPSPPEEDVETSKPPEELATSREADSAFAIPLDPPPPELKSPQSNPIETVLSMPSPAEESEEDKPPHLQAPRYVHHFDTYGLVKDLTGGGFTQDQATTTMKAVRTILSENMDLARRGLVSKSNVENETYLFKAACSELKTEVQNNRKVEADKQRTQRAHLQHEVDILNQKVGQDASSLKDELKGMFDDRKMAVRMEQRNMESKIQELNYKITVALNSDARTEVEGVRWVLTRRAASALAVAVIMVLFTLNYSRYMTATQAKERKKHEEMMHAQPGVGNPMTDTQKESQAAPVDALLASVGGEGG